MVRYGISFAKESTSKDKGGFERKTSRINKWSSVPHWDFEPLMSGLQLDAVNIDSHLIQGSKFRMA